MKTYCFLILGLLINISAVFAQKNTIPDPKKFVTKHQGTFGEVTLNYTATAGETYLKNSKSEIIGSMWSVAYTRDAVDATKRPVLFIFNGGPGSASVWLHLGLMGPTRVQVPSNADADDGAAPYRIVNNSLALLDLADLVFIDPVGTGYSVVLGEGVEEDFWGLNEDARSVAQFIREWVTANQRWNAPKFLAGESFGTTRAAGVAAVLSGGGQDMALNGMILISQALDYQGSTSDHDNLASYLTYLPSMAATAWYHKKAGAGKTLEAFVEEVRKFTYNEYAPALLKGNKLTDSERDQVAGRLAYFIGLDKAYILHSDLQVLVPRFQKELLRDQGKTIGRLDGRYLVEEADLVAEMPALGDAAMYSVSSAYTAALQHYFATDLKVKMDRPYLTSNGQIYGKWKWASGNGEPNYVNVSRKLSDALRKNGHLKVMVANGYYDLVTPFFDAETTFSRYGIQASRIQMTYYEAGHMMYTHEPDFEKLAKDMRDFLAAALGNK